MAKSVICMRIGYFPYANDFGYGLVCIHEEYLCIMLWDIVNSKDSCLHKLVKMSVREGTFCALKTT